MDDRSLVGKEVDLAPWAYLYRADRKIQPQPEANFIPRRIERIDKVYRTAATALSPKDLKSWFYDLRDLLRPLPPVAKGKLVTGLHWTGKINDYRVELHWPDGSKVPNKDQVEVRVYPTSFGWFGWTVDKILTSPTISKDGRTWTYHPDPTERMDSSYNEFVPAATEMVAVFVQGEKPTTPNLHIFGPSIGTWERMDVEIVAEASKDGHTPDFKIQPTMASILSSHLDANQTKLTTQLLYDPKTAPGLESRITLWNGKTGTTVKLIDLKKGPIYIPDQDLFICQKGASTEAKTFINDLKTKKKQGISQMTREHKEFGSFEELMQEVRLSTCPKGTELKPFVPVPDPAVSVEISDQGWTDAWRSATNQLRQPHMWGTLAFEVGRVAHEMDMIGLHAEADKVFDIYLKNPGMKPDGDFADGQGAFEIANAIRHDMGYGHEGTHPSTGRVLFAMSERYLLTGDKQWFLQRKDRMKAAADWIIRQRKTYLKDIPNRKDLLVAGLTPPEMLGDYALPTCDWHWYYVSNALSLQGIQRFADALKDIDPKLSAVYDKEANDYRKDIKRVVDRDAALTPVRLGLDGSYHRYISRMPYAKGLTGPELGAPQFPDCDMFAGALPLAEPFSVLNPNDPRMVDSVALMEEMGTSKEAIKKHETDRKKNGYPTNDAWFSTCFVILPKASHNANIYLYQDDIPNFLRFWSNAYASVVGADGKLWEHWHLGGFAKCEAPDNGTAGWFMELFRNMLMMEVGDDLWIARGTPRSWLEQGKHINVKNAPTYFGDLAYEIVSDVNQGKITATIDVPTRRPAKNIVLRLRHPQSSKIKGVTVNGKPWKKFDPKKETITITGIVGKVLIQVTY